MGKGTEKRDEEIGSRKRESREGGREGGRERVRERERERERTPHPSCSCDTVFMVATPYSPASVKPMRPMAVRPILLRVT